MIEEGREETVRGRKELPERLYEGANGRKDRRGESLQAPRRPDPEESAHQYRQVPSGERDEVALLHVRKMRIVTRTNERTDGLYPRPVGGSSAAFVATAEYYGPIPRADGCRELVRQPRLADSRFAGNEEEPSATRNRQIIEGGAQFIEFVRTPDEVIAVRLLGRVPNFRPQWRSSATAASG